MDKSQEEMQSIGLFGTVIETSKIIYSWRKIFTCITLALIIPLAAVFLAHSEVTHLLFPNIEGAEDVIIAMEPSLRIYDRYSSAESSELAKYWLFKFAYFVFLLVLSLLSTAAVVYTVACIYAGKPVTFKTVLKVLPKVWKRLAVTFLCMFIAFFVYNLLAGAVYLAWYRTSSGSTFGTVTVVVISILYVAGFIYMNVVWQLASVVSVLESHYGFKAMMKAAELVKGKKWTAVVIILVLIGSLVGVEILFFLYATNGDELNVGTWRRVAVGVACLLASTAVFLFGFAVQTVLYLACKSYHHQDIDKANLSDHLDGYLGEYERLKGRNMDVQLGAV